MDVHLSKEYDSYINVYADNNPIWIVTLSNDETIYQDDGRAGVQPQSAWSRLKIYCEKNDLYIKNLKVKNRSHLEDVGSDYDGYFFCKGAGGFLFDGHTLHTFVIGILEGEKLRTKTWRLPELIPDSFQDRDPYESPNCLIAKKGILNEQKLQTQNDRAVL